MDYAKLLLAAEVRRLAREMLVSGRQLHIQSQPKGCDAREEVRRFDEAHPFSGFIADAYAEIVAVSKHIETIHSQATEAELDGFLSTIPSGAQTPTE